MFIAILSGCSDDQKDVSSPVEIAATKLTSEKENGSLTVTPDGAFLARNPAYRTFATRVLDTNPIGGLSSVEAARLTSQALDQTRYPQLQPSAAINQDGDPVGRIGVSQIIFTNGKFQAEKGVLRAAEIEAVADYLISANQRVADGLLVYLEIDFFRRQAETAKRLETRYMVLVDQAERRVAGGVGDETEIATFKLKLLEAQADNQVNRANQQLATSRVRDLTAGLTMPQTPPDLYGVEPSSAPPKVVLLLAQMAAAESQVALERAKRRPSISLDAFTERNLANGENDDGLSLGVGVSVPLGVRNDLEIKAAEANKLALEADLKTTRQDIARRTAQLQSSIQRDKERLVTLGSLVVAAEERLNNFEQQFQSGTVSLEEAVGILDTYRRSRDRLTETRNDMLKAQIEIARTNGQLLPGSR